MLQKAILEGTLKRGDRLESIMQLKNRLCVSRNTVQGHMINYYVKVIYIAKMEVAIMWNI
ncbi:hypothetical protein [Clostridium ljungdahlii]|uniref:hypothetical protein n=1 Tax=Clostridium ljungdahlii TaxID=1538 RepID=UPI00386589DF